MRTYSRLDCATTNTLRAQQPPQRKRRKLIANGDNDIDRVTTPDGAIVTTCLESSSPPPSEEDLLRVNKDGEDLQPSCYTPPSSPPPVSTATSCCSPIKKSPSPIKQRRRRPTFASLRRKKPTVTTSKSTAAEPSPRKPLNEQQPSIANARSSLQLPPPISPMKQTRSTYSGKEAVPQQQLPSKTKKPPPRRRLVQMQLDLGGPTRKTCKACGMSYIPSNTEDVALHKRFHASHTGTQQAGGGGGVNLAALPRSALTALRWAAKNNNVVVAAGGGGERGGGGEFVVRVSRSDGVALRRFAWELLEKVNCEMAAVEIEPEVLWGTVGKGGPDRYRLFLHIKNQSCVGLCLAEQIATASRVVDPKQASESNVSSAKDDCGRSSDPTAAAGAASSLSLGQGLAAEAEEELQQAAMLGIARVWTAVAERKTGIATGLLDCATENFYYGLKIPKQAVAFSQPTEAGTRLARKWFGREYGWLIYR